MNTILCGFMGCGKSTIGKHLAQKYNSKFIDLDDYIVEKQNMSISDIFKEFGEAKFREIETQAITEISEFDNYIVALGGGAILNPLNAEILKKSGKIFFLNISAEEVYKRLKDDTSRPLLQTDDKLGAINDLLQKRMPLYINAADYIIDVDDKKIEEISDEIKNLM